MKSQRRGHRLCLKGHFIYSIGGYDGAVHLNSCEKYDLNKDEWADLPNMNSPRYTFACFMHLTSIMAFGGNTSTGDINSMEKLEINSQSWMKIYVKNPPSPRCHFLGICIDQNSALIFGSNTSSGQRECYKFVINGTNVECCKGNDLASQGDFYFSSSPILNDSKVYAADYGRAIHICDIKNEKWDWKCK